VDFSQVSKETDEIMNKLNDSQFQKELKNDIIKKATKLNDSIDNILDK
jgi:spore coat protein CotF